MIKQIRTLIRGRLFEAQEAVVDRNAAVLLDQQIRDAAGDIQSARRAVAVATAQNEQEKSRRAVVVSRIADLEARTMAALEKGHDVLAREAADAIIQLEADRDTSEKAEAQFTASIGKLKSLVRAAEARLQELQRGQRITRATGQVQKLNSLIHGVGSASLDEAEQTLARLSERQMRNDIATSVLRELDGTRNTASVLEKLADAGCGAPLRVSADEILGRLRTRMNSAA